MDRDGLLHCGIQIILNGILLEIALHWEGPSWYVKDGGVAKEQRELLGIHRGRGNYDLNVSPVLRHVLQYTKEHICIQTPLVRLVHHYGTVLVDILVIQTLPQKDTVCHVLYYRLIGCHIFESNRIPDNTPKLNPHLLGHSFGH